MLGPTVTYRSNAKLIGMLEDLTTVARLRGEPFRVRGFVNAIRVLKKGKEMRTSKDVKEMPIGDSMKQRFLEYVRTRELKECRILHETAGMGMYIKFGKIPYITQKLAYTAAYQRKMTTLGQLMQLPLSPAQKVSVTHYHDSQIIIPRSEIDMLVHALKGILAENTSNTFRVIACGSYRRGMSHSKDIDILISSEENCLDECVSLLEGQEFLTDTVIHGEVMFSGYCRFQEKYAKGFQSELLSKIIDRRYHPHRRIDIRFAPPESFWPAVVYFTGSESFNIRMRRVALEKGFTLNDRGLFSSKDLTRKIPIKSEKALFKVLGMKYLDPPSRSK